MVEYNDKGRLSSQNVLHFVLDAEWDTVLTGYMVEFHLESTFLVSEREFWFFH
jgi:hypothetical protein